MTDIEDRPNWNQALVASLVMFVIAVVATVVAAAADGVPKQLIVALICLAGTITASAYLTYHIDDSSIDEPCVAQPCPPLEEHAITSVLPLLAPAELRAMDITVDLVHVVCQEIIGRGPTRAADINEFVMHIHCVQQTILSQAAGRAYPDRFRLLGTVIPKEPS